MAIRRSSGLLDVQQVRALGLSASDIAHLARVALGSAYRYLGEDMTPPGALLTLMDAWPDMPPALQRKLLERRK